MKYRALFLPAAAFIAAVFLLMWQSRALSSVKARTSLLRQQISATQADSSPDSLVEKSQSARLESTGKGAINWSRLAEVIGERGPAGIFGKQELLRAKARIHAMSPAELLSALADIRTLGLDIRSLGEIDELLVNALGEKDPEAAVTYLADPQYKGLRGGIMDSILGNWAKNDFPAALAWFDKQVAGGTFDSKGLDGKNYRAFPIEAILLAELSTSDPAAAARRLTSYAEKDRIAIFEMLARSDRNAETTDENVLASRVNLARGSLPSAAQAAVIAKSIATFSQAGDYGKIERFLDRVDAAPDERASSIRSAAGDRLGTLAREGKLTIEEVDRFRKWASTQAPGKVDEATGMALGRVALNRGNGFDPTSKVDELVSHYRETGDNDDLLLGFLRSGACWEDRAKARSLGEKIRDPEVREKYFKSLESNPFQ